MPRTVYGRLLWLLLVQLLCGASARALETNLPVDIRRDFHVRQWTTEHGLPDNRIFALCQTGDGYLWMGTRKGVVRFDGQRITTFDRLALPGFAEDEAVSLVEDSEKRLWVGGSSGGLLVLNGGNFAQVFGPDGKPIRGRLLSASPRGGVWVKHSDPLALVRLEDGRVKDVVPVGGEGAVSLHETARGDLWVAEAGRLRYRAGSGGGWEEFPMPVPTKLRDMNCRIVGHGGAAWLLYLDAWLHLSVYELSPSGRVSLLSRLDPVMVSSDFLCAATDGSFWIALDGRGLRNLRGGDAIAYRVPWSRPVDHPLSCVEDREGNLWVGSQNSGLYRLIPRAVQMLGRAEGLPHDNVRCVLAEGGGRVWVGLDDGLAVLEPGGTRGPHAGPAGAGLAQVPDSLPFPGVRKIRFDGGTLAVRALVGRTPEELWVGTARGLHRWSAGVFLREPLPLLAHPSDTESFSSLKLRDLRTDGQGRVWVVSPSVLSVQDGSGSGLRAFNVFPFDNAHYATLVDRAGNLWIASDRAGVGFLPSARVGEFAGARAGEPAPSLGVAGAVRWLSTTNGLPSNRAWELYEAADGGIWVATEAGVVRIPTNAVVGSGALDSPASFTFTRSHGLPDHQVNSLIEDDLGNVWFGTDTGIFAVAHEELLAVAGGRADRVHAHAYGEEDGMASAETNGRLSHPGVCKTGDGRLWFATTKGVAVLDPAALLARKAVPPLAAIEAVLVDGELIHTHAQAGDLGRKMREPHGVQPRLAPGRARAIEFQFAGLHFTTPEQCRYEFRLEGHDRPGAWHDARDRRFALYTNLRPGEYRFVVRVFDRHGGWSDPPATFAFSLAPFVWQTGWFWSAVGLAGVAALAGAVVVRERVVRRMEALKREAAQARWRARVAADLHDGLGANLARLDRLAGSEGLDSSSDPAASGHVAEIAAAARELTRSVREIIWNANPADTSLDGLASQIAQNTQELCGANGIACRLDLPLELPCVHLSADERSSLFFAAKEAVTNVIRHAGAARVELSIRVERERLLLELRDDGRGFDASKVRPASMEGRQGLPNLRSRIESLGGHCAIQSAPGGGTTIRFEIPLAKLGRASA